MTHRPVVTLLMFMIAMILVLPAGAQQEPVAPTAAPAGSAKPFTQDQVQAMVRAGLGDETGAKTIEQRGLDFAPTDDFLQSLKAAGANEAFLQALRGAKRPQPAGEAPKKPLNQVQVFALLAGQVPSHRVAMLVHERGIDFEPTGEYLEEVRLGGGEAELITALKSAKVTKPENVDPALQARQEEIQRHARLGALYLRNKRYPEAETEYRAGLRLDPQSAGLHAGLGVALDDQGDLDGAIAEYRESLPLSADNEWLHVSLGNALQKKGDLDGAIAEYREALRVDPNNELAHANLGAALGNKGDGEGEIVEERAALRLNPGNEVAHIGLGIALGRKGDVNGAVGEFREALRLNPNNDTAHADLGWALGRRGDWEGAIAEYRQALRLNPANGDTHADFGLALSVKGDADGAIAELREALRLSPNNAHAHTYLGLALEVKGDRQGALREYRAAYMFDPTNPKFKENYERMLQQLNQ